jgi:hypothetical protein
VSETEIRMVGGVATVAAIFFVVFGQIQRMIWVKRRWGDRILANVLLASVGMSVLAFVVLIACLKAVRLVE